MMNKVHIEKKHNTRYFGRLICVLVLFILIGVTASKSDAYAASTYKIKVNKKACTVTIYKYTDGKYKAVKAMVCSPGYATPTGTFHLGEKIRWHELDGPTYGQYCSRITGSILFHSVWYYEPKADTQSYTQYNKLGTLASHGCVRLTVGDSKWIYDKIPSGTPVVIYNSSNPGPLGKPSAIKVSGYQGWDPTDPSDQNPYKKKNPVISGVKNQTIEYGTKFKIKKGVTAKNTTGFSATKLIETKVYFKALGSTTYTKVKKLSTMRVGKYKVVYSVKDEIGHKASKTAYIKVKPAKYVKSITLSDKKKTLYIGGKTSLSKFTLSATAILPEDASVQKLTYTSANENIVTVSAKGVVKAVSVGKAYIKVKATDGSGVYARCLVSVEQLVTDIKVTAASDSLEVGRSMQLKVKTDPADATNTSVTYKSSDDSIATVSSTGSVTAIEPGTVVITVKSKDPGKKTTKIQLTIYDPEASEAVSGGAANGSAVS